MNKELFNPVQTTPYTLNHKLKVHLWKLVNKTIFRCFPNQVKKPRILLLRLFGAKISSTVNINRHCNIDHPWNLSMGHLSSLGEYSWIYCLDKVVIGEKCCIGKDVYLITGSHNLSEVDFKLETKAIIIKDCCWVSTGAFVMPGITLAEFSVVGARAMVTRNTESFDIIGGNPAKFIRKRIFNQK